MYRGLEGKHRYRSENVAPCQISQLCGSSVYQPIVHESKTPALETLISDKPYKSHFNSGKSISSCENLFDDLCGTSEDKSLVFNVLNDDDADEFELNFSNILQDVHLNDANEVAESSGSDKENETSSFSLAELFYKGEKIGKSQLSCPSTNENAKCESVLEDSLEGLLSDSILTDSSISEASLENSKDFGNVLGNEQNLLGSFADLLITDKSEFQLKQNPSDVKPEDFEIDLTLAKKNATSSSQNFYPIVNKASTKNSDFQRKCKSEKPKPSQFCKVLCCKVRQSNLDSVPKLPQTLSELLSDIGYNKYFSFDTPSPDDIIKQKQRRAIRKY